MVPKERHEYHVAKLLSVTEKRSYRFAFLVSTWHESVFSHINVIPDIVRYYSNCVL